MTVNSVADAAGLAALLAWLCAAGFLAVYAWGVRRVFESGHAAKPRRGRPDLFSYHLVVVHNDPGVELPLALHELATSFPAARIWVLPGAAEVDLSVVLAPRWRVIPQAGADVHPLQRVRDALVGELAADADHSAVVVGLIESGTSPAPDLLDRLAARSLFGDRRIGAVQVAHRIELSATAGSRRAGPGFTARMLHRLQDLEERGPLAAAQLARCHTHTAILAGTGQFVRVSALDDVLARMRHDRAGHRGLHADVLDGRTLTTGLVRAAHGITYADDTTITRTGAADVPSYVIAHRGVAAAAMHGAGELVGTARAGRFRSLAALAGPLLAPVTYLLGTLLAVVAAIVVVGFVAVNPADAWTFFSAGGWSVLLALSVIAFGEFLVWGLAYGLRYDPAFGPVRGIGLGLSYVAVGLAQAAAVWHAAIDVIGSLARSRLASADVRATRQRRATGTPAAEPPTVPPGIIPEPARARRRSDAPAMPPRRVAVAQPAMEFAGPVRPHPARAHVGTSAADAGRRPVAGTGRHRA